MAKLEINSRKVRTLNTERSATYTETLVETPQTWLENVEGWLELVEKYNKKVRETKLIILRSKINKEVVTQEMETQYENAVDSLRTFVSHLIINFSEKERMVEMIKKTGVEVDELGLPKK